MVQGQPWSQFGRSLGSNTSAVHVVGPTTDSREFIHVAQGREELVRVIILTNADVDQGGASGHWLINVRNVTTGVDLRSTDLRTLSAENPISNSVAYNIDPDQNRILNEGDVLRLDCETSGTGPYPAFGADTMYFVVTRKLE